MAELEKFTTHLNEWIDLNKDLKGILGYLTIECIKTDLDLYAEDGHYFKINNEVLGLFLSTKPISCYKALRLPFSSIYLDIQVPLGDVTINGILLNQVSICKLDSGYLQEAWEFNQENDDGFIQEIIGEDYNNVTEFDYSDDWNNLPREIKDKFREFQINGGYIDITFQILKDEGDIGFDQISLCYSNKDELMIDNESRLLNNKQE